MAVITRTTREKVTTGVDFQWSSSLSYNAFRLWELIFWRRAGIRAEMSAGSDGTMRFFTWEARIVYTEDRIKFFLKRPLPILMAKITGTKRYRVVPGVDFEWDARSWAHNVCRAYEMVFYRRYGVRAEASARVYRDEDGQIITIQAFHSFEAVFKHVEHVLRTFFKWDWMPYRIYIPMMMTTTGMPIFASPYLFAIAQVSSTSGTSGGGATTFTSSSFSFGTIGGAVFVGGENNTSGTITSASCTDKSLTSLDSAIESADVRIFSFYGTGTYTSSQTVTINGGSAVLNIIAGTYSGVSGAAADAHGSNTSGATTSYSQSLTTIADNCWLAWVIGYGDIHGGALTAGANTTFRQTNTSQGCYFADTNGVQTPPGSKTMTVTEAATDKFASCMVSMAPATINYDAVGNSAENTTANHTWNHTCTGSNGLLTAWGQDEVASSNLYSVMSYNGTSFLSNTIASVASPLRYMTGFYLIAPTTGSSLTMSATVTGGAYHQEASMSYSGVKQSSPIDNTNTNTTTLASSITTTITPTAANCYALSAAMNQTGAISAPVGQVSRFSGSAPLAVGDSSVSIASGSAYSMTWGGGSGGTVGWAMITASIAPAGGAAPTVNSNFLMFM